MKKQTLEEFINSQPYYGHGTPEYLEGIKVGAKWQQEQAKEMEKEQENELISKILQIQNLPPHIDESGADGTQGWDGIPDKETEQEEKLWTNEEVFDMLYKTDKFLMVELREYWKTIKKH